MSREEIVAAIQSCAEEMGRVPTIAELKRLRKIGLKTVKRFFGCYAEALREAGFDPHGAGFKAEMNSLFLDWAGITRRLGKIPSIAEYKKHSQYSVGPLMTRFGGWTEVPRGLLLFAREKELEAGWEDVMERIERHEKVNEPEHPPLVKPNKGPARLFAQGWLPFQKIWMRRTSDRGKMPGLA